MKWWKGWNVASIYLQAHFPLSENLVSLHYIWVMWGEIIRNLLVIKAGPQSHYFDTNDSNICEKLAHNGNINPTFGSMMAIFAINWSTMAILTKHWLNDGDICNKLAHNGNINPTLNQWWQNMPSIEITWI